MSMTRDYLSCAESAAMLRASLKRTFPTVKFSVRSKTYAGGASITVAWKDGPTAESVQRVTQRFEGADFDGMQDLKSPKNQILVDAAGNARAVHFGSDYIFCNRETSPEVMESVKAILKRSYEPLSWAAMPDYEHDRMAWRIVSRFAIPFDPEAAVSEYFRTGGAL